MRDDYRIGVNGLCPKCGRRLTTTYCMNCSTGVQTYDRGDGLLVSHGDYSALRNELNTLRADLARVKAESLRVVVDGDACRICDADEGVILVGGNVYQITDHSEWIGMAEGVRYLHQEMPEYDEDTIVQPVRLERWEDE